MVEELTGVEGPDRHLARAARLPLGVCAHPPAQHVSGHQGFSALDESPPGLVLAPGALGTRHPCSEPQRRLALVPFLLATASCPTLPVPLWLVGGHASLPVWGPGGQPGPLCSDHRGSVSSAEEGGALFWGGQTWGGRTSGLQDTDLRAG